MDVLKQTLAAIPPASTRRVYGTAYHDGARWWANVEGNLIDALWLDPIQPMQDGPIVVDITNNGTGQSSALVLGGYTDQPRPSTGTVLAVGVSEIVFGVEDGQTYTTDRVIGAVSGYALQDPVYLDWAAGLPTILGKPTTITITPEAPPPVAPAPAPVRGVAKANAVKTNTWWAPGGWGSYAQSQYGGEQLYSGTWSGLTVTGSWFYGNSPLASLGSREVTAVRFWLPARQNVGNPATATVHLYAHTSRTQPGSDVSRTVGPHDVTVSLNRQPGWITLPLSFAAVLKAGGGISIAGDPYVAFNGRLRDPLSGRIEMDWTT